MSIREQAWQAFQTSGAGAIAAAEQALRDVLDGLTVDLDLVAAPDSQGRIRYVFTDGADWLSIVELAGVWEVQAVAPDAQGWVEVGRPVTSLAELARWLPVTPDEGEPAPAAWEPKAYPAGTFVTHIGKTWRAVVDVVGNWEPGAPGIHQTIWAEVA